jgi:pimeloyl-ACP methyl ester carboxylesterase
MAVHPGEFRRARHAVIAVVLFCLLCLTGCGEAASPTASAAEGPLPTVVLVHGAFADASSWNGVVTRLQKRGYTIVAPALGMRGLASDSAYLASLLSQIKGPVVLAGHSYGGAVISNAATGADNVKALVFVNGFATEDGEVLSTVEKGSTDSALNPALGSSTTPPATRRPEWSCPSIQRSSPRFSAVICLSTRRRCWPPPSARSLRRHSPSLPAHRRGSPGRARGSPDPRRRSRVVVLLRSAVADAR